MISLKEKYVVDDKGKRIGIMLDIKEYHKILEALEELESIRAYDRAKASKEKPIPFSQAVVEIETKHR
jgi:sporulation protein YlmC with PRC-barrel domain